MRAERRRRVWQEARLPNALSILVDCELTLNTPKMVSEHPPFYITTDPHRRKHIFFKYYACLQEFRMNYDDIPGATSFPRSFCAHRSVVYLNFDVALWCPYLNAGFTWWARVVITSANTSLAGRSHPLYLLFRIRAVPVRFYTNCSPQKSCRSNSFRSWNSRLVWPE